MSRRLIVAAALALAATSFAFQKDPAPNSPKVPLASGTLLSAVYGAGDYHNSIYKKEEDHWTVEIFDAYALVEDPLTRTRYYLPKECLMVLNYK